MDADKFLEHMEMVCQRRSMVVIGGSFYEVCAYLTGLSYGLDCPLSGDDAWRAFNAFVCAACCSPANYCWPYVLKLTSRDEDDATTRLQSLLREFVERSKNENYDDIIQDMRARSAPPTDSEPVKVWRRFSRAILRGNREEIEPIIQRHPNADVLWAGAYPEEVGLALADISESYQVSQIDGSEAEGCVVVLDPDFGPTKIQRIDGEWRVDASKVIECWTANRDREIHSG